MASTQTALPVGTKVRTLYYHSETATVVRPQKRSLPLPSPDWCIVQFTDGKRACIHRDMLALANCQ